MREFGIVIGAFIGMALLLALVWVMIFGFRWVTAGPRGELQAREQILSGPSRIAAYNHFFNLCASVQSNEDKADQLIIARSATQNPDEKDRLGVALAGTIGLRNEGIRQYNQDALKDYTVGQFQDLDLPYQLPAKAYPDGGKTVCATQ